MANPVGAGDEERYNEDEVAVDPDVVGEVIVEVPIYLNHLFIILLKIYKLSCILL